MELDFDKEIDALLRKARSGTGAATAISGSGHVDADEIAAFAENALPEKIRQTYIVHFAECDRCRKILSQAILLNAEADQQAASLPVVGTPVETRAPWRQRLFGLQSIAYTMGTLVLLFSAFLGYMVWQKSGGEQNTQVSQVSEKQVSNASTSSSSSVSNTMANAANAASNAAKEGVTNSATTAPAPPTTMANAAANTGPAGIAGKAPLTPVDRDEAKPMAAPQIRAEQPVTTAPAPKPNELKQEEDSKSADKLAQSKGRAENEVQKEKTTEEFKAKKDERREAQLSARKLENLPLNGRNAAGAMMDSAVRSDSTRSVGGRTFQKKDGVWYDGAYHGQATINVHRGTDAYKKLDSGLRSIADSLGGTVVTVWKGKAYRIQ